MQKLITALLLVLISSNITIAQETIKDMGFSDMFIVAGENTAKYGKVEIFSDAKIDKLLQKHIAVNSTNSGLKGFRIQIYFNSGYNSREEALRIKNEFETNYPNAKAYLTHQSPFFRLRVGNFRTRADAMRFEKEIKLIYRGCWIVEDKIEFPSL